ncbi:MAG: 50S ribosomal protein L31e [Candidatus Freyarchaeum deiterrae]
MSKEKTAKKKTAEEKTKTTKVKTAKKKISEEKEEKTSEERAPSAEKKIVLERVYTVPLKDARYVAPNRRASKAIRILKKFIERHLKAGSIVILPEVNEKIWERGIKKPPRKIRVKASKDEDGLVEVALAVEE